MTMSKSINLSKSCYVQLQEKKLENEDRQSSSYQISRGAMDLYHSLKLYSETRSKTATDDLHALCLGISYQRVLDITKNLYDSQRRQYEWDGVLVPCQILKNVFTIFAKVNIDLNARSADAKSHYHGTSLSGLQYPNQENPG